jgi:hypothetical protein
MSYRIARPRTIAIAVVLLLASTAPAETPLGIEGGRLRLSHREDMPSVSLRGYGPLSGCLWTVTGQPSPASLLQINCVSDAKAQLVLAKYLSDLGLLPGVRLVQIVAKRGTITARSVENQGAIAALRSGNRVVILAARKTSDLHSLYEDNLPADFAINATEGEVRVPSYLDRWDKHGFRFYYGPFVRPKKANGRDVTAYDPVQDFIFASDAGHAGMVVWHAPHPAETAEGIMNTVWWDWVLNACRKYGLPAGINCGLEDKNYWVLNRFPEQAIRYQPQFLGSFYGSMNFGIGEILSWNSVEGKELALAQIQKSLRQLVGCDNIVNWLEPHEEMGHGAADVLVEYGPVADQGYRRFLQSKYGTVQAVAERWFGKPAALGVWEDVHLPELAHFAGWGPEAVDLTGRWRINYDTAWGAASAAPELDDSTWPTLVAPGHSIVRFLAKRPAVFRRHFQLDPAWRAAHPRIWLYLWDLNDTRPRKEAADTGVHVFINGKPIAATSTGNPEYHWAALEVGKELIDGDNLVTLDLPQGMFNYRCYLSAHEPKNYPNLGPELNAQWADYSDFNAWCRGEAVRRGAQMIRQVDPNRPITFMSPDTYAGVIKPVCEDFGGVFHNTGYMAGVWANFHCMEMASSGLPTDVEPGSGAVDVPDFKRFMGRWSTEGVQGVDYFQHVGDIEWREGIRQYFLKTLNLWHLIGKYHTPPAQVATLHSDRVVRLLGFPWQAEPGFRFSSGHWPVRINEWLLADFPLDEVLEVDFERGNASAYRVILDTNTCVMDEPLVGQIETWVRAGGIFVTYGETGRHSSTHVDSWPISRLSGYRVLAVAPRGRNQAFRLAPGQPVFRDNEFWAAHANAANLLVLKKEQSECRDLLVWQDGTVAAGMRPLGRGFVIQLGTTAEPRRLLGDILDWAKIPRIPAAAEGLLMRHFVSNNGLYDVWAMWNDNAAPRTADLAIRNGLALESAWDVEAGRPLAAQADPSGVRVGGLRFDAWQTRVLLTPRLDVAAAPVAWFQLQRRWWKGTSDPGKPLPDAPSKLTVDLTTDWAFQPLLPEQTDVLPLVDPKLDDSAWKRMRLGIVTIPDNSDVQHALLRKRFTVPVDWNAGRVTLWIQSWNSDTFLDAGRVYLDGQPLGPASRSGITGSDVAGSLRPGTTHVLAVEISGPEKTPLGTRGPAWIAYHPEPAARVDLSGPWEISVDGLRYAPPVTLPGPLVGKAARRTVKIDASHANRNVVVHAVADNYPLAGVLINGRFVLRFRHNIGSEVNLNITPWVKFGQDNELILVSNGGNGTLREVSLEFHARESYP